ncbi:DUF262 domain-containing protein [Tepidiforma flava]|uniref:DUF262 domain-containing protein n=1 Tax=Tepidiforma flava TaxID=3004094 RepID=A0ABY7M7D2_9CHLR|nr:DUF262 domain-containing protein [Tepidiforma flava]WBL36421.1 DUF262 domain-containing protein [Tepidiforma flava]
MAEEIITDLEAATSADPASIEESVQGMDEGDLQVQLPSSGIVLEKNDRSLSELFRWWKSGRLILDPDWQRHYVWDRPRASRLIESVLIELPIPVIYLAKNDEGNYEVIDGLQRLTSVFRFFDNEFKLSSLEIRPDLKGKFFKDLPLKDQNRLHDATLRTFELSPKTPKDLIFLIFERLNTGGQALNDMEIRNSLFRGPLNDLIKRLAENQSFKRALSQPQISKRMQDRALVLRFLAFYERTHLKARGGLKRFLNEFLETYRNAPDAKLREYEDVFDKCMKASVTVFGSHSFRLFAENMRASGGWSTRPNAAIFQAVANSFSKYDLGAITRASDSIYEEYCDLISTDEHWVDCVRRATGESTRIDYVFETWTRRLDEVLRTIPPNDSKRLFSRSLKSQMWAQDRRCAICGNEIKVLEDAVLDHEQHYWRGGKTVPENARLAHRSCNASRQK